MVKKIVRRLLWIIGLPILIIVLVLGYLGFVPGVSALFGSDKPVDLGAPYTEADRLQANEKFNQEFTTVDSGTNPLTLLKAADVNNVTTTLSQEEVAAHVEETHPVRDMQVVFHDDGTFEAAGRLDKSRVTGFLRSLGFDNVDEAGVLAAIDKYVPGNPPFYVKGTGSVTDEEPSLELTDAKIGRLPLATGPFAEGLLAYAKAVLDNVPGFDAALIAVEGGMLRYEGTAPAVVPIY